MTRRHAAAPVLAALAVLLAGRACTAPGCRERRHRDHLTVIHQPVVDHRTGDLGSAAPSTPTATTSPSPAASAAAGSVRFSVLGDIGSSDATAAVLRSIAARHDDFSLAVGDLSYGRNGAEDRWCRFVTRRVGTRYPFELVSGNHESNGENGDIDRFVRCLPNRLSGLVGTYGRQWYVDQPADHPLVRVVMISPALDFGQGNWSYDAGTSRHDWLRAAVTGARAAGIPWVVVGMHKPCLSLGRYVCDPGPDVVDLMLETGVDLVVTGHEHLYQRSRPLALGPGCRGDPSRPVHGGVRGRRRGGHHLRHGRNRGAPAARGQPLRQRGGLLRGVEREERAAVVRVARRAGDRRPADRAGSCRSTGARSPTGSSSPADDGLGQGPSTDW